MTMKKTMLAAGAALLALAVAGCAALGTATGAAAGRKTNVAELDESGLANFSGWLVGSARSCRKFGNRFLSDDRPKRIHERFAGDETYEARLEKSRRYYAGVDGLRGDTRGFCDQVDAYLDDVLREIAAREKSAATGPEVDRKPRASDILFHFRMDGNAPASFTSRLHLGAMPDKLFIRNPYRDLVRGAQYSRIIRVYDPEGKLVYSNRYNFSPKSRTWNIWHWLHPDEHFDAPGDWRIVTRLSGGDFSVEKSRILPVVPGNPPASPSPDAPPPTLEDVRLTYYSPDKRMLFSRTLAPEIENPDVTDELRARDLDEFSVKIAARLSGARPVDNGFYFVQIRRPDGQISSTSGIHFSTASGRKLVTTDHGAKVAEVAARPGLWKMEFFVGDAKIGERIIRVAP